MQGREFRAPGTYSSPSPRRSSTFGSTHVPLHHLRVGLEPRAFKRGARRGEAAREARGRLGRSCVHGLESRRTTSREKISERVARRLGFLCSISATTCRLTPQGTLKPAEPLSALQPVPCVLVPLPWPL